MSENHMTEASVAENKMGVMPIPKLLITMSLPMMLSMLVQALYNIVDSMFVAQLSEDALTAVSLAFPIQTLMIAISSGTGVGINALLSRNLGEKNFEGANSARKERIILKYCKLYHLCHRRRTGIAPFLYDADGQSDHHQIRNGIYDDYHRLFCRNLPADHF